MKRIVHYYSLVIKSYIWVKAYTNSNSFVATANAQPVWREAEERERMSDNIELLRGSFKIFFIKELV